LNVFYLCNFPSSIPLPSPSTTTMTANGLASEPGDAFLSHLIAVLSIYELSPFSGPLPLYNGKTDWHTDSILRSLGAMARRMYSAEEQLSAIKASHTWQTQNGPDTKPRRISADATCVSSPSHSSQSSAKSTPSLGSSPTSEVSDISTTDVDLPNGTGHPTSGTEHPDAAPMSISLDGLDKNTPPHDLHHRNLSSVSAPSSSHIEHAHCPTCGKTITDGIIMSRVTAALGSPSGSPLVVPPGPLAAAAFESGMSAIEELRLLKAQVQDVARVCNAVARGDLRQKITVPVQGVVMVQLKDVINTMVLTLTDVRSLPLY
jgi:osomolarity two-component system, sensor histidine kinase NIK1